MRMMIDDARRSPISQCSTTTVDLLPCSPLRGWRHRRRDQLLLLLLCAPCVIRVQRVDKHLHRIWVYRALTTRIFFFLQLGVALFRVANELSWGVASSRLYELAGTVEGIIYIYIYIVHAFGCRALTVLVLVLLAGLDSSTNCRLAFAGWIGPSKIQSSLSSSSNAAIYPSFQQRAWRRGQPSGCCCCRRSAVTLLGVAGLDGGSRVGK